VNLELPMIERRESLVLLQWKTLNITLILLFCNKILRWHIRWKIQKYWAKLNYWDDKLRSEITHHTPQSSNWRILRARLAWDIVQEIIHHWKLHQTYTISRCGHQ
jgi:hypothetical protein